ncbi:MAG: hypothetical protein JRI49_06960, partial [Deltaproteobacteria bacterium]|nr:hypothetical protein [Deltaproteobacteria bacterium]
MIVADRLKGRKTLQVSNFLDEFEKDEIRKRVDIVELFNHFGVNLTKKGKSYMGRCPFPGHEDKNPSLSVDREKGVYNCFGCGESGDIFSLTGKMKGCGFRESADYLKSWKSPIEVKPAEKKAIAHKAKETKLEVPDITLNTVTDYYHKTLYNNQKALAYLKKRGLESTVYSRFKLGFADGSLMTKLSKEQKEALKQSGILRENGTEHFCKCIIFPITDEAGTTGLYGRSID